MEQIKKQIQKEIEETKATSYVQDSKQIQRIYRVKGLETALTFFPEKDPLEELKESLNSQIKNVYIPGTHDSGFNFALKKAIKEIERIQAKNITVTDPIIVKP